MPVQNPGDSGYKWDVSFGVSFGVNACEALLSDRILELERHIADAQSAHAAELAEAKSRVILAVHLTNRKGEGEKVGQ